MSVLAVAAKELELYFTSFLFYALAAVFLALAGYFFYTNLGFFVLMGGMDLPRGLWQYQFLDVQRLLLVLVPLLTMRLFAEERRQGTLELLWTYPVRDASLIGGKYLAALAVLAAMLLLTFTYPAALAFLYPIDLAHMHGKPVCVGGPDVSSSPHLYKSADFQVIGEAEHIMKDFVAAF